MTSYVRVSMAWVKTGLLVVIAVLFALNLLLPVRYTLQLVPVTSTPPLQETILAEKRSEPSVDNAVQAPKEAASVSTTGRRDETNKDVSLGVALPVSNEANRKEPETFASFLKRTLNDNKKNDNNDKVPEEKNKLGPYDPHSRDNFRRPRLMEQKHRRGMMDDFFEKKEGYGADPDVPGPYRVNFHDPIQRLAYYRKLRQRLGGPDARLRLNRRQSVNRKDMIRDIWGGWFENDEDCKL